jgi:hypothetical protein
MRSLIALEKLKKLIDISGIKGEVHNEGEPKPFDEGCLCVFKVLNSVWWETVNLDNYPYRFAEMCKYQGIEVVFSTEGILRVGDLEIKIEDLAKEN